jgi:hypothetical protein
MSFPRRRESTDPPYNVDPRLRGGDIAANYLDIAVIQVCLEPAFIVTGTTVADNLIGIRERDDRRQL